MDVKAQKGTFSRLKFIIALSEKGEVSLTFYSRNWTSNCARKSCVICTENWRTEKSSITYLQFSIVMSAWLYVSIEVKDTIVKSAKLGTDQSYIIRTLIKIDAIHVFDWI